MFCKDRQGELPLYRCCGCGGEIYRGETWTERDGEAFCVFCQPPEEVEREGFTMNRSNRPVYRRGREKYNLICSSLQLLRRYRDGHRLSGRRQAMAKLMDSRLTERELELLSCYYEGGMTHKQIARLLDCAPSTVSKGVARAEGKFWEFAEILSGEFEE